MDCVYVAIGQNTIYQNQHDAVTKETKIIGISTSFELLTANCEKWFENLEIPNKKLTVTCYIRKYKLNSSICDSKQFVDLLYYKMWEYIPSMNTWKIVTEK